MTTAEAIQTALEHVQYVLLDFDGPVCDIYAGLSAPTVAGQLSKMLTAAGVDLPDHVLTQDDPLEVFRYSAVLGTEVNRALQEALTDLEVKATATAEITPGVEEMIRRAVEVGKPIAIVSNNSVASITAFLSARGLLSAVSYISGRTDPNPALMKPNPYLVSQALDKLTAPSEQTMLVGDSLSDIEAAKAAGVISVGYANKPGKADSFASAGAEVVVTRLDDLVPAL
ncbi:HAD family hydrolase [Sphaerisporangium rubeum]|uniref:HAD superfamily hydrolase (TIGR01662 family) n=1 Tax=Sphaerisporangium rubeum TaxID=321317 RepID=A0A7X0IDJ0_9ACTN|nr:HAD superfamily hydrolase (TIGR01662 family) [Sphaerisporangium rubeum]